MQFSRIRFGDVRNKVSAKHRVVVPAVEPEAFPLGMREFSAHARPVMVKERRRIAIEGIERYVVLDSGRILDFAGEQRERIYADILPPHATVLALVQHFCSRPVGKTFHGHAGSANFPFRGVKIKTVRDCRIVILNSIGNQLAYPGRTHHITDFARIIAIPHDNLA